MIFGLGAILLLPLLLLGARLEKEVAQLIAVVKSMPDTGLPPPPAWLVDLPIGGERLDDLWRSSDIEGLRTALNENIVPIRDWVLARSAELGQGILQILLSLVTAFFFYRDGPAIVAVLQQAVAKVTGSHAPRLSATSRATINGVARGVLGTAVIQAILLAIGFALAGVPAPIFLGFIAFFLSLIPAGLALLWIPAALWLAAQGMEGPAVFMAIWGAIVGFLDNFMRPYLMAGQTGLPFLLVLLGVIGGVLSFGLVGLFLGPILLAIALNLVREWVGGPREEPA
jgi:predicted PurR-regulated permease PerM